MVAITAVQLVAWLVIYRRLAGYSTSEALPLERWPSLTVIVCARNEAENLRRHLPRVLEQDYPHYNVLVVDDDSHDATSQVLSVLQVHYPHLHVLRVAPKTSPGKKAALTQAIVAARSEWLVFTDADCWPASAQWLQHLARAMRTAPGRQVEIVLGYGPLARRRGLLSAFSRFETAHTALQYSALSLAGMPYMGVGRNLAWKQHLFARTEGFKAHADMASGDDDLFVNAAATRRNTAVCLHPGSFVYSEAPSTWAGWLRQKRRHLSTGPRYRLMHRLALSALAASHGLHYLLLLPLVAQGAGTLALACWSARIGVAWILYAPIAQRLRVRELLPIFPLLDAMLGLYFVLFVPFALAFPLRHLQWR